MKREHRVWHRTELTRVCRAGSVNNIALGVTPDGGGGARLLARETFQVKERWFCNVLVVQERLGVTDRTVLGLIDVMLLSHVIVPINPLGQEPVRAVVMFRDGAQDRQAVQLELSGLSCVLTFHIRCGFEQRQSRFRVFPEVRSVP